jgi:DNA modification methylase
MERVLDLSADDLRRERHASASEDVHFTEAFARAVIEEHSARGEVVLDPFAGYGTTLVVAERLGRVPVGIELLPDRVDLVRARLRPDARVVEGDARRLDELGLGTVDLCLTSPPYMTDVQHPQNPLTGYTTLDGDYAGYLDELLGVFLAVKRRLRPGGHLVVNAANLRTGNVVTPLAWDVARLLRRQLRFCGETYLRWDRPPANVTGDYCLVFRND